MRFFDLCMSLFMLPVEYLQFLIFTACMEEELSVFDCQFQHFLQTNFSKLDFMNHVCERHEDCSHACVDYSWKGNFFCDVFEYLYSFFIRDIIINFDDFKEHMDGW